MLAITDCFGSANCSEQYLQALAAGQALSASLVLGSLGETQDLDGGSRLLGGPTDLKWLRSLRAKSDLVVTSGRTYRAELYRMPKTADLAVISRSTITPPEAVLPGQRFLPIVGDFSDLGAEILGLQAAGYKSIHLEFGPSTLLPMCRSLGIGLWLSSEYEGAIEEFCELKALAPLHRVRVDNLSIAYCR